MSVNRPREAELALPSPPSLPHLLTSLWVRSGWLLPACVLLASLFALWTASAHNGYRNDDSYITLTYVKSLAAGQGWRYNGGIETLGSSTPLFALLVAGLARLLPFWEIATLAIGLSTAAWVGMAWLFFLAHQDFGLSRGSGALLGVSLLLHGGWLLPSLGMEGSLLLFGLTGVSWLTARGHGLASGLGAALLFLVRPEGAAMLPLAAVWHLWQGRGLRRFTLGAALPLLLWVGYAWPRFGTFLPTSVLAKAGQGHFWPGLPFGQRLVAQWLPAHGANYGLSSTLSLLWPLAGLGLLSLRQQARPLWLLMGWGILFLAAYTLLSAPGYWWYMLPLLFLLQLLVTLGLARLLTAPQPLIRGGGLLLTGLFLTLCTYYSVQVAQHATGDPRAPTYLAAANWLNQHSTPGATVAAVEIGYLGYFSHNPIIDLVGLLDPALTANGVHRDFAKNFWQSEAEYLLYSPRLAPLLAPLVQDERFQQRYQLVAEVGPPDAPAHLYQRR